MGGILFVLRSQYLCSPLKWGSANVFCHGTASKYFRRCRPRMVSAASPPTPSSFPPFSSSSDFLDPFKNVETILSLSGLRKRILTQCFKWASSFQTQFCPSSLVIWGHWYVRPWILWAFYEKNLIVSSSLHDLWHTYTFAFVLSF